MPVWKAKNMRAFLLSSFLSKWCIRLKVNKTFTRTCIHEMSIFTLQISAHGYYQLCCNVESFILHFILLSEEPAWKCIRASCSAPTYFTPFQHYLDGGLLCNNPTNDALTEIIEYNMSLKLKVIEIWWNIWRDLLSWYLFFLWFWRWRFSRKPLYAKTSK